MGYIYNRYNDRTVLYRQITKDLQIPKVSEYIRINRELYVKLFLEGPLYQFYNGSDIDKIVS